MNAEVSSIENRPKELFDLPYYKSLPELPLTVDVEGVIGDFLAYDLFKLDGVQPTELRHSKANNNIPSVNPSEESIKIYREEKVKFQLINVVVNAYGFEERDGVLHGKPYSICLKPATKRDKLSEVSVDWVDKIDLEHIDDTEKCFYGFNPFSNAYGFYSVGGGFAAPTNIESDMIGFVYKTYALATKFDAHDLIHPLIPQINDNNRVRKDYERYRKDWYFKKFTKDKPKKIWGCDSPIELFLLQAMDSIGLTPDLQMIICEDGLTVPSFHKLWENQKSRKRLKVITESDFYFPSHKLAIFCDSKKHHSSPEAIAKDKAIDEKLKAIDIRSLRLRGDEIVKSPIECAKRISEALE